MIKFSNNFGNTPIDPNEMDGLIPAHITTQAELNEWEQTNIIDAKLWLNNRAFKTDAILNHVFMKQLHQKMFGKTWRWAGNFRKTDKNIGTNWHSIPIQIKQLFDDVNFQLTHNSYNLDEIATRFHHRLVFIHPFANGNGRFSRLITGLFLTANNAPTFSWGLASIKDSNSMRKRYIMALKAADKHDYSLLLKFVRS